MLAIVVGFTVRRRNASPVMLYCGDDADEALKVLENPPVGIAFTQAFRHMKPWKKRVHEVPEGVTYELPGAEANGEVLTLTVDLAEVRKLLDAALEEVKGVTSEVDAANSQIKILECLASDRLIEIEDLKGDLTRTKEANELALKKIVEIEQLAADRQAEIEGLKTDLAKAKETDLKLDGGDAPPDPKKK